MSKFFLINTVQFGTTKLTAGSIIDEQHYDTAALVAAGAILWPDDSAGVHLVSDAAARANAQKLRGGDDVQLAAIMRDAVAQTQLIVGTGTWGDGRDGSATLDGTATVSWASKASAIYTLTGDVYLHDLTIAAGVTLKSGGFRLHVNGTLTNNGTICNDGYDANGQNGGARSDVGTLGAGMAGGNGRTNNTGVAGTNQTNCLEDANAAGGAGGAGGANAGGAGGTYAGAAATNGGGNNFFPVQVGMMVGTNGTGASGVLTPMGGGAGGGGGGSDAGGTQGGGGGGGGGVLCVHAFKLVNNGTISAKGGKGADATGASNGGGGGGGGGGLIQNISRYREGTGAWDVSGGLGGAKVGASGVAGSAGNVGHVNQLTM